eukprot:6206558-Pleurochrysis_carterae.AAC.4
MLRRVSLRCPARPRPSLRNGRRVSTAPFCRVSDLPRPTCPLSVATPSTRARAWLRRRSSKRHTARKRKCTRARTHTGARVHVRARMRARGRAHACARMRTHTHTRTHMRTHARTPAHARRQAHARAHARTHAHTGTHTQARTHAHARTRRRTHADALPRAGTHAHAPADGRSRMCQHHEPHGLHPPATSARACGTARPCNVARARIALSCSSSERGVDAWAGALGGRGCGAPLRREVWRASAWRRAGLHARGRAQKRVGARERRAARAA